MTIARTLSQTIFNTTSATNFLTLTPGTATTGSSASTISASAGNVRIAPASNSNIDLAASGNGQVLVVAGTATVPALVVGTSTNTGLFSAATNQISVASNGIEGLRVNTTGTSVLLPTNGQFTVTGGAAVLAPVALTAGATVTPDLRLGNNFTLLGGATPTTTLANPVSITSSMVGQSGFIAITQPVSGFSNITVWGNVSTITMTIASPAVVTLTASNFTAGQTIVFTTTGALPTGITAGSIYYVIAAGLSANTFEISATLGGTAVITTGTQSGTHTGTASVYKFPGGLKPTLSATANAVDVISYFVLSTTSVLLSTSQAWS